MEPPPLDQSMLVRVIERLVLVTPVTLRPVIIVPVRVSIGIAVAVAVAVAIGALAMDLSIQ
jgi:hypothetical protein